MISKNLQMLISFGLLLIATTGLVIWGYLISTTISTTNANTGTNVTMVKEKCNGSFGICSTVVVPITYLVNGTTYHNRLNFTFSTSEKANDYMDFYQAMSRTEPICYQTDKPSLVYRDCLNESFISYLQIIAYLISCLIILALWCSACIILWIRDSNQREQSDVFYDWSTLDDKNKLSDPNTNKTTKTKRPIKRSKKQKIQEIKE